MDALLIEGPVRLSGMVSVSGSKNTALPFLFSSILFDKPVTFSNVPRLWDIETTCWLLETMGARTDWDKTSGVLKIEPTITKPVAAYEWVRKMRAGILALGPLLARFGEARVSLPGGCAIGARPVGFHIDGLKKMGVSVEVEEGYIQAKIKGPIKSAVIEFPEVTVTGTENLMIFACASGEHTIIEKAAREPEVIALGEFLISCGARIQGLGTSRLEIYGGKLSVPRERIPIPPDRIETGTWIAASVQTGSPLTIEQTDASQMVSVLNCYREMGVGFEILGGGKAIQVRPPDTLIPIEVSTEPYPGFPTDMQAQILTNLCQARGRSVVRENIFENRFMHVAELRRLGAKINVKENTAVVEAPVEFKAAPLMATDLRASACLVIAALSAKGTTKISRIYHLDRGYQRLDDKLRALGAKITRVADRT